MENTAYYKKCGEGCCRNMEESNIICYSHHVCGVCTEIVGTGSNISERQFSPVPYADLEDELEYNEFGFKKCTEQFWCKECKECVCSQCQMDGLCEYCYCKHELEGISDAIMGSDIIKAFDGFAMNIITEIAECAVGHIIECIGDKCSSVHIINNGFEYLKWNEYKKWNWRWKPEMSPFCKECIEYACDQCRVNGVCEYCQAHISNGFDQI